MKTTTRLMLSGLALLIFCLVLRVLLLWVRRLWYQLHKTERKGRYNLVYIILEACQKLDTSERIRYGPWPNSSWGEWCTFYFFFLKKGCFRLAIQDCTKVNPTCISFFVMNFYLNMIYIYIHIVFVGEYGEQRSKVLRRVL